MSEVPWEGRLDKRRRWQIAPWSGQLQIGFGTEGATVWREAREEEASKLVAHLARELAEAREQVDGLKFGLKEMEAHRDLLFAKHAALIERLREMVDLYTLGVIVSQQVVYKLEVLLVEHDKEGDDA